MAWLTTVLKPQCIWPKLSPALKLLHRQRSEALTQAISKTRQSLEEQAKALAEKHRRSVRMVRLLEYTNDGFLLQNPEMGPTATTLGPDKTPLFSELLEHFYKEKASDCE
jgi:hypothetical protein